MPRFFYKAKKDPLKLTEGILEADNKISAIRKLSEQGFYIISIEEYLESRDGAKQRMQFRRAVKLKDITNFTRQLSDLLESGLTIVKALDILHDQTDSRSLKDIILDVRDFCIDGNPLSSAFARHPAVFPHLFVSLVRSGEAGGALVNILNRLADYYDTQLDIQTKVRSAFAYPILMSVVGCLTITVLLTFVIPKMMVMFGDLGQSLPLPTLILITITGALRNYWWIFLALALVVVFSARSAYKTKAGRRAMDAFKLSAPVFGPMLKKIEIARFARTLATLLHNGVPILESLGVVADTVSNAVIKDQILKAQDSVKNGSNLATGFSQSTAIPPLVINMIAVGEEAGRLDQSLLKVAESYERESDTAIKIMLSLLEPILILALGMIVGFIVISMLLPIFEINFLAR